MSNEVDEWFAGGEMSVTRENMQRACAHIVDLLAAMRRWGAQEDGIPEAHHIADTYDEAAAFMGLPLLNPEEE